MLPEADGASDADCISTTLAMQSCGHPQLLQLLTVRVQKGVSLQVQLQQIRPPGPVQHCSQPHQALLCQTVAAQTQQRDARPVLCCCCYTCCAFIPKPCVAQLQGMQLRQQVCSNCAQNPDALVTQTLVAV